MCVSLDSKLGKIRSAYSRVTMGDFFFSSRRRHTRCLSDWSSDVCSSDLVSVDIASASPCNSLCSMSDWYSFSLRRRAQNGRLASGGGPARSDGAELVVSPLTDRKSVV